MIDNDETGHELLIDKVYVNIENDTFYGIDGICIHNGTDIKTEKRIGSKYVDQFNTTQSIQICGINTVHSNTVGVDQSIDYKPGKQIIEIDIDRPNEWINNARWSYKDIGSQCDIFSENYILVQQHLSWNESQTYCNIRYETDLASIHDDIQNTEAMRLCDVGAYYPNCHIGLNDIDNESFSSKNGWVWIDGTEYGAYHHWDDGDHPEPSQQEGKINEDCVEIRGADGTWNDIECSRTDIHFLCNIFDGANFAINITSNTTNCVTTSLPGKSNTNPYMAYVIIVLIVIGILCAIVCVKLIIYVCNLQKKAESLSDIKHKMVSKTMYISHPMVIVIGIGEYEQDPTSPEVYGVLHNLFSIGIDIKNIIELFGTKLGYSIFPNYNDKDQDCYRLDWAQNELISFLTQKSMDLETNLRNDRVKNYDGLIVMMSCHGIDDHYILTSDYKKISKTAIHRVFSARKPLSRKIPRIFIFDCCSGHNRHNKDAIRIDEDSIKSATSNESKMIKAEDIQRPDSVIWARDEDNPDYKLVVVHAANEGFQSIINSKKGSYVIAKFTEKLGQNIEVNDNNFFLHEILDDVQEELHDIMGKQLMSKTFYNRTEYIKFERNVNKLIASDDDEDEKEVEKIMDSLEIATDHEEPIKSSRNKPEPTINEHWRNVTKPYSLK